MKKYFIYVTTQYDGLEWVSKELMRAENRKEVIKNINTAGYYTHDNGIEIVKNYSIKELTEAEYAFLQSFI